jgi:hypothetical protein
LAEGELFVCDEESTMKNLLLLLLILPFYAAVALNLRGATEEFAILDATMADDADQYGQMQELALDGNVRARELWWWKKKKKSTFCKMLVSFRFCTSMCLTFVFYNLLFNREQFKFEEKFKFWVSSTSTCLMHVRAACLVSWSLVYLCEVTRIKEI